MSVQIRFHGGPQDGNVRTFDERMIGKVIHVADTYAHAETIAYKMQGTSDYPFTYSIEEVLA